MKVATIIGTRPEIIRLSCVIEHLTKSSAFEHVLVHTGQNYDHELNQIFFDNLKLPPPNHYLEAVSCGDNVGQAIGNIISKSWDVLCKISPDAVLILGDTNSSLSAIAAKRLKIPVFHMEAGNRCFDDRVPEELNRRMVDHISDVNMTYSHLSREFLINEGLPPDRIINVGSPMYEVLNRHVLTPSLCRLEIRKVLKRIKKEYDVNVDLGKYYLVSLHREENVDTEKFNQAIKLIRSLAELYDTPVLVSTHPRTWKRFNDCGLNMTDFTKINVHFLKPVSFTDYVSLQMHAKCVLSDSGTISEESAILGFNAINLRETHERPEANEHMPVVMAGLNATRVYEALAHFKYKPRTFTATQCYKTDHVSEKVARIILSYTDYINRNVWHFDSV